MLFKITLSIAELGALFFSILSLFVLAYILGEIFSRCRLPRVIGELSSGLVLGPSGLGWISPTWYQHLFNAFPEQGKILSFLYWFGLMMLMLSAGFFLEQKSAKRDRKIVIALFISSTFLPIIGGIIYYKFFNFLPYLGASGTPLSMIAIVCMAVSITSIPVISKIFIDLNILNTRFAKIVLIIAALHDIILWGILGVILRTGDSTSTEIVLLTIYAIAFLVITFIVAHYISKSSHNEIWTKLSESSSIFITMTLCLLMVFVANFFGINIIFGALMAGIMLSSLQAASFKQAKEVISKFSLSFFVPLYFSIVGLKINLPESFSAGLFISFLIISTIITFFSVVLGLKLIKETWLTSVNFAIAMTTRGGPGIVLASVAYEAGLINSAFFVVLVLVAITTSLFSGVWFRFVVNKKLPLYE